MTPLRQNINVYFEDHKKYVESEPLLVSPCKSLRMLKSQETSNEEDSTEMHIIHPPTTSTI